MTRRHFGGTPRRRIGDGGRIVATTLLALVISALLARSWALAMQSQGGQAEGFQTGSLSVEFADGLGGVVQDPAMEAGVVLPGGPPVSTPVTIRNSGTLAATYTVSAELAPSSGRSLDDVLVLTVTDPDSGEVLYSGKLSELSLNHSSLKPGASMSYVFEISWPSSAKDDLYQGLSFGFSLRADAQAA
jgi:hypothetical protein